MILLLVISKFCILSKILTLFSKFKIFVFLLYSDLSAYISNPSEVVALTPSLAIIFILFSISIDLLLKIKSSTAKVLVNEIHKKKNCNIKFKFIFHQS